MGLRTDRAVREMHLGYFGAQLIEAITERLEDTENRAPEVFDEEVAILNREFADFNGFTVIADVLEGDDVMPLGTKVEHVDDVATGIIVGILATSHVQRTIEEDFPDGGFFYRVDWDDGHKGGLEFHTAVKRR